MPRDKVKRRLSNNAYYIRMYRRSPAFRRRHLANVKKSRARRRAETKRLIADFKRNGCALCPEDEPCCMSAHHRDRKQKRFTLGKAFHYGVESVRKELAKCVCVCENCHRKIHAGLKRLPVVAVGG